MRMQSSNNEITGDDEAVLGNANATKPLQILTRTGDGRGGGVTTNQKRLKRDIPLFHSFNVIIVKLSKFADINQLLGLKGFKLLNLSL